MDRYRLLAAVEIARRVAQPHVQGYQREEGVGPQLAALGRGVERRLEASRALGEVRAGEPPGEERHGQPERDVRVVAKRGGEGGAEVVVLGVEPRRRASGSGLSQRRYQLGRERLVPIEVPALERAPFARLVEPLGRVLANGFEQPVAGLTGVVIHRHERLVHQPVEQVEHL